MIVMYHKFGYELDGEKKQIDANMVVIGENRTYTAMSKTVGLPVAMDKSRAFQFAQPLMYGRSRDTYISGNFKNRFTGILHKIP